MNHHDLTNKAKELAQDPELRGRAARVASHMGTEALEGAGLIKIKDSGKVKVRKLGIAKAVLRPTHSARRGGMAATRALRQEVRQAGVDVARTGVNKAFGSRENGAEDAYGLSSSDYVPSATSQTSGRSEDPRFDLFPKAESYQDAPAVSDPNYDPYDLYGDRPRSTTAAPVEAGRKGLFGRSKKDKTGSVAANPSSVPAVEDPWSTSGADYPTSSQPSQSVIEDVWGTAAPSSSAYGPDLFDTAPTSVPDPTPSPRLGLRDRLLAGHHQRHNEQVLAEADQARRAAEIEAQANDPWRL